MAATKLVEMMLGMTGTVLPYALSTAPAGWMICDGSALAAGTADHLRAALIADGNPYGESGGDPLLPDLRGEFIRGLDNGRGVDTGRELGSAQGDANKSHQHSLYRGSNQEVILSSNADSTFGPNDAGGEEIKTTEVGDGESRPRNVAMNYIIKT